MGIAVLRSHDCLDFFDSSISSILVRHLDFFDFFDSRPHLDFFDSRPPPPMNASRKKPLRSTPQKQPRPARSKPNPARLGRRSGSPDKENNSGQPEARKPLVMGQFILLKKGEMLPPPPPAAAAVVDRRSDGDVLCSTNRMGPDPEILPKFSDLTPAVYAGPAFNISSPSPSSLPFPAFFLKKSADEAVKSEIATRGLRCLLRLDEIA